MEYRRDDYPESQFPYNLGSVNTEFQVNYLGTRLEGEAREWFLRKVEHFERDVRDLL